MEFYLTFRCGDAPPRAPCPAVPSDAWSGRASHSSGRRGGSSDVSPGSCDAGAGPPSPRTPMETGNCTQLTQLMGKWCEMMWWNDGSVVCVYIYILIDWLIDCGDIYRYTYIDLWMSGRNIRFRRCPGIYHRFSCSHWHGVIFQWRWSQFLV
jgi:hypothetical protein